MNAYESVKKAFTLWQEGQSKMDEANRVLSRGPATFYYGRLEEYVTALFTRFAPFEEGDRVCIVKAPKCEGGWAPSKHFLIKGATGVVQSVDYTRGLFCADVVFDDESRKDLDGKVHKTKKNKHTFRMDENEVKRIDK